MSIKVNISEENTSIDIQDVGVNFIEIVDLTVNGSITVNDSTQQSTDTDIQIVNTINTITLPSESDTSIEIQSIETSQIVTIETAKANVIEITDNIAINDAIVSTATNAAARALTAWNANGEDIYYHVGNVGINTSEPKADLHVHGNISGSDIIADTFTGLFVGALSSSAQIATDISGAFSEESASFQSRLNLVESGITSKRLVSSSGQFANEISGAFSEESASFQSRLNLVESGLTGKRLLSSSTQIMADITASFRPFSSSAGLRLTDLESTSSILLATTLISGSAQIADDISGSFSAIGLISSSAQIADDISGSFNAIGLLSSSVQIADDISGSFTPSSASFSSRVQTLESNVGQELNIDSDVKFFNVTASNVTASNLLVNETTRLFGTFALNGVQLIEDQITVRSGSTIFGSGSIGAEVQLTTHEFTGSLNVSGSIISTNNIDAPSYTGIFVGALSSSAQIAEDISGSFNAIPLISSSVQIADDISGSFSSLGLISSSIQISDDISGSFTILSQSIQTRINNLELTSSVLVNKSLISSSAQIAEDISGSFTEISASIASEISASNIIINQSLISSSAQIATEISGAFNAIPLISSSAQIATEISGAFNAIPLISSSAQIADDISGSFNNISFSDEPTHAVVVYDNINKKFHFTGSYAGGSSTSVDSNNIQFATGSSLSSNLTNLVIKDFSDNVSVNVNEGTLELVFGIASIPFFIGLNAIGFDSNRFNLVKDDYTLSPSFNLNNATFIKGELSASNEGIAEFSNGSSVLINSSFPSFQSGSHTFTAKVLTTTQAGDALTIQDSVTLSLNKLNPSDPTINVSEYDLTLNAVRAEQEEIEEGATGTITWNAVGGNANGSNGWVNLVPQFSDAGGEVGVSVLGNVTTGTIQEFWNSSTNNNPVETYIGTISKTWTRVRSLRYMMSNTELPLSETYIQTLSNWSAGTIKTGFNTISEVESCTIVFNATSPGQYLYIVYDKNLGSIDKLMNQESLYNEFDNINWVESTHGNYQVISTPIPKDITLTYKLEF